MSGTTSPVLTPVSRALSGTRRKKRSDQCWEVTDADLNMYGMIVGRAPSDSEKLAAIQKAKQRQELADARAAEEAGRRPQGGAWSPAILCSYLRGLCVGTVQLRVGGPQFTGWVRQLSAQARQRLQESQARLAGPRAR